MTPAGWVFMILSICFVVSLVAFCFFRVLSTPASTAHMRAPLEIETHERT